MGLKPREPAEDSGGGGGVGQTYVSSVTAEEMQAMAAEYADGYPSDEDLYEEAGEAKEAKPNLASKMSSAVKNFSLPSPNDIMNSNFVKSFHQPLMVKSKIQNPKVLQGYQATIAEKSPNTLSKINKLSDFPLPSMKRKEKEEGAPKGECNGATEPHEDFGYGTLRSLKETKLITNVTESGIDDEKTLRRRELTKTMTPAQLAEIHSIKDFPLPNVFKKSTQPKVVNGESNGKAGGAAGEEEEKKGSFFGEGFMDQKLMTNCKEGDPDDEKLRARQVLVKTKSPAELASITSFSDFPVPCKIENLYKGGGGTAGASVDFSMSSLKEGGQFNMPESLKMNLMTNSAVEDEEIMEKHRELVNSKSVAQLSQIHSFAEFPIPTVIENLVKKKEGGTESGSMLTKSTHSLANLASGNFIPESLRETKLVTNVKEEVDHDKIVARQNLIKSKTPMELSQIKDWSEFPIPARLQNLQIPTMKRNRPMDEKDGAAVDSPTAPPRQKSCNNSIYESLPSSLRGELCVRSRPITDEEANARQELIRSKSPTELSQISSFKDIPVPRTIEKLFDKGAKEMADGKEKESDYDFIEKYSTLPPSLTTKLQTGCKTEDQALVQKRQEVVKSKSVSELSEIKSMSDIPIPSTLQRLSKRDHYAPVERKKLFKMQMKSQSSQSINHQPGTLPRSLKEQNLLLTSSKIENPSICASRRSMVETRSVAELSRVTSLADVPVPSFFTRLASRSLNKLHSLSTGQLNESSAGRDSEATSGYGIYAALPSLNTELLVGKSVQDLSKVEERRHLVNSKSVSELSQVKSLKDIPVPDAVQRFCAKSMERLSGNAVPAEESGEGGSGGGFHLPSMLTQPCIVTTKIEDPQTLLEHQQIQQQKSVHELSKIRNLNEIPVPGNLFHLPDVPIPKAKDLLKLVARPPRRKTTLPSPSLSERLEPDSQMDNISNNFENSQIEEELEDNYSHLEDSYEVITKEEVLEDSAHVEAEEFGLASQIKGTPERNTRSNKKKKPDPRNRRSQEDREEQRVQTPELVETPPPLPPKRSPHKQMSVESQLSTEECSPAPVKGVLTLEAMNGNVQVKNEVVHHSTMPEIQARPLPTPPAPVRYNRTKHSMERQLQQQQQQESRTTTVVTSSTTSTYSSMDHTLIDETANFQTCRDTMMTSQSRTLMVGSEEDDNTMADSIVESLVSCTDTLICDEEDTDDDPYPSVNFESGMSEILDEAIMSSPGGGAGLGDRRLEQGTQQLSEELMNHVDNLRSTLDNMSNRLGARSRSRSSSRPRSGSRPPTRVIQDKM
jgi:hypothetical protein